MILLKRICICLMFVYGTSASSNAQEHRNVSSPSWTSEDTAVIIHLAKKGLFLINRNLDSALAVFREMESHSRSTGFSDGIGYALSNIGVIYSKKGMVDTAFQLYRTAFPYCIQARYLTGALGTLYANIGSTYMSSGNYNMAGYWYHKCLDVLRKQKHSASYASIIYHNLASVHFRMMDYDKALYYVRQSEMLAKATGCSDHAFLASLYGTTGSIYGMHSKLDTASYYFKKALLLARESGAKYIEQNVLNNIGNLLMANQRPGEALKYYQEALALNTDTSQLHGYILPAYSIGACLTALGRYREAEAYLVRALEKSEATGLISNKRKGHKALAELYRQTGDYVRSLEQRDLYDKVSDSLTGIEKARILSETEARFRLAEKNRIIAQNNLQLVRQQRNMEKDRMVMALIVTGLLMTGAVAAVSMRAKRKIENRSNEIMHLQAVMTGQENERERIAQELHDGIGSMLTALKLEVAALKQQPVTVTQDWEMLTAAINEISEEVHKAARNLTPGIIQQYDLWQALVNYCEPFEGKDHLHIDLQSAGDLEHIPAHVKLTLYRVVQELIQNAVKHSGAGHITIILRREASQLYLSVEDDGRGFDTSKSTSGLGLQNMYSRIKSLNGYCTVSSFAGQGTTAFIEIDLNQVMSVNNKPVS